MQVQEQQRFAIRVDCLLTDQDPCPFCGQPMDESFPDSEKAECINPECPYATQPEVRDVVAALIDNGHDPLRAAQIAATYSIDGEPVTRERFAITDMGSADWVLKKMADVNRKIADIDAMVQREYDAITRRREELVKPLQDSLQFFSTAFGPQLAEWASRELEGGKSRSVKLLHGKLGFRKSPDTFVIDNDERALAWAESNAPAAIKREIRKTEFRKAFDAQRDANPGLQQLAHYEPGADRFYIDPESLV
jgi:phage host-nuclease inhibitor protein Gam